MPEGQSGDNGDLTGEEQKKMTYEGTVTTGHRHLSLGHCVPHCLGLGWEGYVSVVSCLANLGRSLVAKHVSHHEALGSIFDTIKECGRCLAASV